MKRIAYFAVMLALLTGCSTHKDITHAASNLFNDAAVMFTEMMIPHHQQAIELADIALSKSNNPEVIALAEKIKVAQAPEISEMQSWLSDVKDAAHNHGMEMPGYIDEAAIAKFESLNGNAFDVRFLELMIAHHRGAIDMANEVLTNANEDVKNLALEIVNSQTSEITEMQNLIASLS